MIDDAKIIELFFKRSESAISELDIKYGKLCRRLSHNIVNNPEDAEECVNDAYLGAWNTIPPANPSPLQAFICKIVRNVSLKCYYRNVAQKRSGEYTVAMQELEAYLPASDSVHEEVETRELTAVIERFLDSLGNENCAIFMRRYYFSDTYAEIASSVGLSEKSVSMRLVRIRKQLKKYLCERGIYV